MYLNQYECPAGINNLFTEFVYTPFLYLTRTGFRGNARTAINFAYVYL